MPTRYRFSAASSAWVVEQVVAADHFFQVAAVVRDIVVFASPD